MQLTRMTTTTTSDAGVPLEEVKKLLTDATQQLAETLDTLTEFIEEAGQTIQDPTSDIAPLSAEAESEPDHEVVDEPGMTTSPTHLWIAGVGLTAVAVGAGVYLYTRTDLFDDGFSFSAVRDRAYNVIADKANQTRTEMGGDEDPEAGTMTLLGRIGHAATFTANLVLSSVVTSIGEKARSYLDVDAYVETAHERVMQAMQEPLNSIQNTIEEQVQAVQDAVEEQVQAVQDAVEDKVKAATSDVQGKLGAVQDQIAAQVQDVTSAVSDRFENAAAALPDQIEACSNVMGGTITQTTSQADGDDVR